MLQQIKQLLPQCKYILQGVGVVEVISINVVDVSGVLLGSENSVDRYTLHGICDIEMKVIDVLSKTQMYTIDGSYTVVEGEVNITDPIVIIPFH
jgi:hypothetical protein